jgi:hypothetical protein
VRSEFGDDAVLVAGFVFEIGHRRAEDIYINALEGNCVAGTGLVQRNAVFLNGVNEQDALHEVECRSSVVDSAARTYHSSTIYKCW